MEYVFTDKNDPNYHCIFTEEHIEMHMDNDTMRCHRIYPYGSIKSIEVNLFGVMTVKPIEEYYRGFIIGPKCSRSELKAAVSMAKKLMKNAPPADVINLDEYVKYKPVTTTTSGKATTSRRTNTKDASVVGRAAVGAVIAGPVGAVVGAISAADKNNRKK